MSPFFSLAQPLEPLPSERQMRIANLGAFPQLVRELGVDPRPLLERHHIDPLDIQAPDHLIDCTDFTGLLEECSAVFNDPLFGLNLAERQEPDVYGCVIALCRAAATVREAIDSFVRYLRVTHSPASVQELVEGEHTAELRWFVRADLGVNRQANYHATLLIMKLLRQIVGRDFRPSYLKLTVDARRRDILQLEQRFGCRFQNARANNTIAFPRALLDRPVASASRVLYTLLRGYLDCVKASAELSMTEKVQHYIRSSLASGGCSIEHCAEKLGVAVRTLQTALSASGHEFSALLQQQRVAMARAYLQYPGVSLDDIATNLGYTEQTSFSRAFKRWTGTTPSRYRRDIMTKNNTRQ